jgi:hypothetical protein
MTPLFGVISLIQVAQPPSATGVVALAGLLLVVAVICVVVVSFMFHRRSGRR